MKDKYDFPGSTGGVVALPVTRFRRDLNTVLRRVHSGQWSRIFITRNNTVFAVALPYSEQWHEL